MPPKPKFTRDEIIDAAYCLMEERGIEAVVAREVGKVLGTTTGPIFTFFSGMDELKEEVYKRGLIDVSSYLDKATEYQPSFKEFGLRWIRYAKEHPNVYSMVFLMRGVHKDVEGVYNTDVLSAIEPMKYEVSASFGISLEQAEDVINKMAIYAQGIASLCITSGIDIPEEQINRDFGDMCLSLIAGWKIRRGDLDEQQMKAMLNNSGIRPGKKQNKNS